MGETAVALFKLPFRFIGWLFKHPKVAIIFVLLIFILIGVNACNRTFASNSKPAPNYAQNVPTVQQAGWILQTDSRQYYINQYSDDGKVITLMDYYTYDKKVWKHQTEIIKIDRKYYAYVSISSRKG